jgi:hypothetical protein
VDNKKWLTSLFVRNASGNTTNLQGVDGLAGTYPFGTYLIDPSTGNPQEFIGINIGRILDVEVAANVLTLTFTATNDVNDYIVGTSFQLWGMVSNPWLNGATITLTDAYTHASSTNLVAVFNYPNTSTTPEAGFDSNGGLIIQAGTTPVIAKTGGSVPTWGAVVPVAGNDFLGSITLDGNTVWVNRGTPSTGSATMDPAVENWGIKAPITAPTYTVAGQEDSWAANTYYSPASIYLDSNNNLWQITTPGKTGSTIPSWNATPTPQQKVVINSVAIAAGVATFLTDTQSPALVTGDTIVLPATPQVGGLEVATFLNGQTLTVLSTSLSTTEFKANVIYTPGTYTAAKDYGFGVKTAGTGAPSTETDGTAVWTCIQLAASLTWTSHTHYNTGDFIIATIGGTKQFQQLGPPSVPFADTTPSMDYLVEPYSLQAGISQGAFQLYNSTDSPPDNAHNWQDQSPTTVALKSLNMSRVGSGTTPFVTYGVNGAGELDGTSTTLSPSEEWIGAITCKVFIPVAGNYTFSLFHYDGAFFSFDTTTGAVKQAGTATNVPQTKTASLGYGTAASLCGTNQSGSWTDSATWHFPAAGEYGLEIDFAKWSHSNGNMQFLCPGPATTQNLPIERSISGATLPIFSTFTATGAHYDSVNDVIVWGSSVTDNTTSKVYTWNNVGPVSDFLWQASTSYTSPGTQIIDPNANQQAAYETGVSGKVAPVWSTAADTGITADTNPPLTYLNEGAVPALTNEGNTFTETSAQGALYWIALVNTLDQTVSNLSPVSLSTGPFVKGQVTFAPGAGLDKTTIDPQADYVAIFRSADGFTTPLLIPGFVNSPYTVPLVQYLEYGYVDTVPDVELNNLVEGPLGLENTPPPAGTVNLTYHLNRIWYSVGNSVFWTSGPIAPIGNGDGTAPGNVAALPSTVKRLVPTAIGMIVLTQSDVYIIAGNGTPSSPILPAIPYLIGVGLGNYNALDINGGLIGFMTTDKQFVIFDPSAGLNYVGFNIGDQFRLNNGTPGQSWTPSTAYVAWYVNGEDAGWYVADGANGWYRMIYTPAPEQGTVTWSPFATIQGTCGAIASIETSPGVHELLIGQTVTDGDILSRDLNATTDNGLTDSDGTPYIAYGVIGSIVLANPGQIAKVAFITTICVRTGSPLIMGVILNEALPYYTGSFDILKRSVSDPPGLPESKSFYKQRFYLDQNENTSAYCTDMQILVQFAAEAAQSELQTITLFGAYEIEA